GARLRPPAPSAGHQPTTMAGQAPSASAAARQASGDEALPDVTLADGSVDVGEVRITLSLAPQPPVAFAKFRARIRASSLGSAVALEGGRITFEMTMPMGDHRYSLVPGAQGWQEAEVVLPLCPSGKRRWYATVEGATSGQPRTARFRFDLTPAGQPPTP
ncbi:MAG: hypothetical protein NTY02_10250, partial [Acidobacteria bacterium]|nr:hypothetical protein [Acidobacteriota bacterium]